MNADRTIKGRGFYGKSISSKLYFELKVSLAGRFDNLLKMETKVAYALVLFFAFAVGKLTFVFYFEFRFLYCALGESESVNFDVIAGIGGSVMIIQQPSLQGVDFLCRMSSASGFPLSEIEEFPPPVLCSFFGITGLIFDCFTCDDVAAGNALICDYAASKNIPCTGFCPYTTECQTV